VNDIIELPDGIQKVDVIISEFMGSSFLYESRMDTVVIARNKWLASGGIILPDTCTFYIFGFQHRILKEDSFSWLNDPQRVPMNYGISMEPMKVLSRKRPRKCWIPKQKVHTHP